MRVLWFTNTPSLAARLLGNKPLGGGWIESLEREVKARSAIALGICFFSPRPMNPFETGGVQYYPIFNGGGMVRRWLDRLVGRYPLHKDLQSMLDVVTTFKPDLIHIHGTEMHFGLIQEHIPIPTLVSIQGNLAACVEKYYGSIPGRRYLRYLRPRHLYSFDNPYFHGRRMQKKSSDERRILTRSKHIAGRTEWDKDITRLFSPSSQYYVINEILRPPFYNIRWDKRRGKAFHILTTTSNAAYKGFEVILKTARLLRDYGLEFQWEVIGISKDMVTVKAAQDWLGISHKEAGITLRGPLDADGIVASLLNSDVYVQTSHVENSSNSLCEAMLAGIPVIASYAGGTCSIVRQDTEGLLYQDGDALSLAGKILKLSTDEAMARQMGARAREAALTRHEPGKVVQEVEVTYQKIINHHRDAI